MRMKRAAEATGIGRAATACSQWLRGAADASESNSAKKNKENYMCRNEAIVLHEKCKTKTAQSDWMLKFLNREEIGVLLTRARLQTTDFADRKRNAQQCESALHGWPP